MYIKIKNTILTLFSVSILFPLLCSATQKEQEKLFHSSIGIYYPDEVKEKIKDANSGSGASCANLGFMWINIAGRVDTGDKISSTKDPMTQCYKFAIHWLEKAVILGDGPAASKLAEFYSKETLTGCDEEMDSLPKQLQYEKKAFELLEKNSSTSLELWILTQYYKTGKGTAIDDAKANETYKKYLDYCKKENVSPSRFGSPVTDKNKVTSKDICKNGEPDEQEKLFYSCMGTYYPALIQKNLDKANKGSGADCGVLGQIWITMGEKVDWNNRIWNSKIARKQCFKFAVDWLEKGVQFGDVESASALAWFYSDRFITGRNEGFSSIPKQLKYAKKAFELLQENPVNSSRLMELTKFYKHGCGVTEVNETKAKETYKKYINYCKKEFIPVINYSKL